MNTNAFSPFHPFAAAVAALEACPSGKETAALDRCAPEACAPADPDSLPTRRSLLRRLGNLGDSESWRTFFELYWRLIYNVAVKSGLSDDQAQEVVQDTVIAVARKMPEFRYDPAKGSFKSWLLLICRRRIHDQLRRIYSARQWSGDELGHDAASPELPPDAQLDGDWQEEWRAHVFQTALQRVRLHANPKHYQAFDCCVLQNMRAGDVASLLGLSTAQVYLVKHRMTAAVKRAAKEIEAEAMEQRAAA